MSSTFRRLGLSELLPRYIFGEGLFARRRVLELGAVASTQGQSALFLATRGARSVVACDESVEAVEAARGRIQAANLRFRAMVLDDLEAGTFDFIAVSDLAPYVRAPALMAELARLLARGGCLMGGLRNPAGLALSQLSDPEGPEAPPTYGQLVDALGVHFPATQVATQSPVLGYQLAFEQVEGHQIDGSLAGNAEAAYYVVLAGREPQRAVNSTWIQLPPEPLVFTGHKLEEFSQRMHEWEERSRRLKHSLESTRSEAAQREIQLKELGAQLEETREERSRLSAQLETLTERKPEAHPLDDLANRLKRLTTELELARERAEDAERRAGQLQAELGRFAHVRREAEAQVLAAQESVRIERARRDEALAQLEDARARLAHGYEERASLEDARSASRVEADKAQLAASRAQQLLEERERELDEAREREGRLAEKQSTALAAVDHLKVELQGREEEALRLRESLRVLEGEKSVLLRVAEDDARAAQQAKEELEAMRSRHDALAARLAEAQEEATARETDLADFTGALERARQALDEKERALQVLEEQARMGRELRGDRDALLERANDLEAALEDLRRARQAEAARLTELDAELSRVREEAEQGRQAIAAQAAAEAQLARLESELADAHAALERQAAERAELQAQVDARAAALDEAVASAETLRAELQAAQAHAQAVEAQVQAAREAGESLERDVAAWRAKVDSLEADARFQADERARLAAEVERLEAERSRVWETVEGVRSDLAQAQQQRDDLQTQLAEGTAAQQAGHAERDRLSQLLAEREAALEQARAHGAGQEQALQRAEQALEQLRGEARAHEGASAAQVAELQRVGAALDEARAQERIASERVQELSSALERERSTLRAELEAERAGRAAEQQRHQEHQQAWEAERSGLNEALTQARQEHAREVAQLGELGAERDRARAEAGSLQKLIGEWAQRVRGLEQERDRALKESEELRAQLAAAAEQRDTGAARAQAWAGEREQLLAQVHEHQARVQTVEAALAQQSRAWAEQGAELQDRLRVALGERDDAAERSHRVEQEWKEKVQALEAERDALQQQAHERQRRGPASKDPLRAQFLDAEGEVPTQLANEERVGLLQRIKGLESERDRTKQRAAELEAKLEEAIRHAPGAGARARGARSQWDEPPAVAEPKTVQLLQQEVARLQARAQEAEAQLKRQRPALEPGGADMPPLPPPPSARRAPPRTVEVRPEVQNPPAEDALVLLEEELVDAEDSSDDPGAGGRR